MKTIITLMIPIFAMVNFNPVNAQCELNIQLAKTIDSLMAADQAPAKLPREQAAAAFSTAIHSNFPLVKAILEKFGFPGYNLVGKESSHNYWILVQHSDFDVSFQKTALKEMKKQLDKKNASGQDYAYLTDRIELNEKKPQVYGTQIIQGQGRTKIKQTVDSVNLDKRRRSVGLEPIADYLKRSDEIYEALNNGTLDQLQKRYDSLDQVKSKKNRR